MVSGGVVLLFFSWGVLILDRTRNKDGKDSLYLYGSSA